MSDEQQPPNGTPVPMPAPVVGELCHVCVDEKRRFKAVDDVVWFTLPTGQHVAHLACFWKARADSLERENVAAQQALAIVLAAKGGMVTVTLRDLERAKAAKFSVESVVISGGRMRYVLAGPSIEIVGAGTPPEA